MNRLLVDGFKAEIDNSDNTMKKKIMNAETDQWNYMLTVGKDEELLGMVDIRARGGKQLGKMRIDAFIEMIKTEVPPKSKKEEEYLSQIWKSEDYVFDKELYERLMEEDKKRKE